MYRCASLILNLQKQLVHPLNVLAFKSFSSETLISLHKKSRFQKRKLTDIVTGMLYEGKEVEEDPKSGTRESKPKDPKNLSVVKAYVIGSGAVGAPKAFYVMTDQAGYLFNCGEWTQRMSVQLDLDLEILENIFITNSVWDNIGGIPGMALTSQFYRSPFLNVHGPLGIGKIFQSMKTFVSLKHIQINIFETVKGEGFNDGIMDIKYVPIYPSEGSSADEPHFVNIESNSDEEETDSDDEVDVDFYDYTRKSVEEKKSLEVPKESITATLGVGDKSRKPSICYICKTPHIFGKLNLEECAERNVPAGPLFAELKRGQDIELPNGDVVKFKEVSFPDVPGKIFLVIDCPGKQYLDSLLEEPIFKEYQIAANPSEIPVLIVHFSHPSVMNDPKYIEWMKKFPKGVVHLRLNEDNIDVGTPPAHELQTKLNLIHEEIFPLLPNPSIPIIKSSEELKDVDVDIETCLQDIAVNFDYRFYEMMKKELLAYKNKLKGAKLEKKNFYPDQDVLPAETLMTIDFKNFSISSDPSFALWPEDYVQDAISEDGSNEALEDLKKVLSELEPNINSKTEGDYPRFLFLGTGSSAPQSSRNTSGILVFTAEDTCMLLDCGEGTYNQLNVFFGKEKAEEVMLKLKAIFVSHLHADHHLGFLGLLKGRRRAIDNYLKKMKCDTNPEFQGLSKAKIISKLGIKPLHLLAPNHINIYLKLYHSIFEDINADYVMVSNSILKVLFYVHKKEISTISRVKTLRSLPSPEKVVTFLKDLHLQEFKTTHVRHCADAYGVTFITNNNFKVTYSGDCMPSGNLTMIGENSDLLIHEATMDSDMKPEAARKLHSTTDQAIEMGAKMNAKFTLLTHFSQRYIYLPRCTEIFSENVGVAFDMMTFSIKQLPLLPKFMPALRLMFAKKLRELDYKYYKTEFLKFKDERKLQMRKRRIS